MLGGLARVGLLEVAGPDAALGSLLAVNVVGSALLGVLVGSTTTRHAWLRPFAGTGVLGGFTTYSAAVAAMAELTGSAGPVGAAAYLAGTLVASVLAAGLGLAVGGALAKRRTAARQGLEPEVSS